VPSFKDIGEIQTKQKTKIKKNPENPNKKLFFFNCRTKLFQTDKIKNKNSEIQTQNLQNPNNINVWISNLLFGFPGFLKESGRA
jgi:hypothetical protein